MKKVGVLALQGSFAEHCKMLRKLGVEAVKIRSLKDVAGVQGCILPGGESTTIGPLLKKTGLDQWLLKKARAGMPIYGTCAGMIVLSKIGLKLIDVDVARNAYGPQLASFEDDLKLINDPKSFHGIFIRAPKIKSIGKAIKVLAYHKKDPVLLQQKNIMIGAFHPELTEDDRIHRYFLGQIKVES